MKKNKENTVNFGLVLQLGCTILLFLMLTPVTAQNIQNFKEFKGAVVDAKSHKPLEFATIALSASNISTISNKDGNFIIKVPQNLLNESLIVNYLGYKNTVIPLSSLPSQEAVIKMQEITETLPEVNLVSKDPQKIVRSMLANRDKNFSQDNIIMTAFYRESIKKRRAYASLSEAVVEVYKKPFSSASIDYVKLVKARKSTDYKKIDTLVIKLQGGPYNTLNIDLVKNEDMLFNEDLFENYQFTFDKYINLDNRGTYVVNFVQSDGLNEPMFYGKLYIDAQSYALSKARFSLKLDNKKLASKYFVKKKPSKATVTPMVANYSIDYRMKNNKWYYGYGRIELSFKINWKKKIFNSVYHMTIEKAVTDWHVNKDNNQLRGKEKLKTNVILNDKATGFANPEFWGENNVIEPDKSIENAIKKIKKHLN